MKIVNFLIFLSMILPFLFPIFLVGTLTSPEDGKKDLYTTASCISFDMIIFTA